MLRGGPGQGDVWSVCQKTSTRGRRHRNAMTHVVFQAPKLVFVMGGQHAQAKEKCPLHGLTTPPTHNFEGETHTKKAGINQLRPIILGSRRLQSNKWQTLP